MGGKFESIARTSAEGTNPSRIEHLASAYTVQHGKDLLMAADAPLPRVLLLNGLRVSFHYPGDPNRVAVHHQLQHQTLLAQTRCVLDAARCQFQVPDAAVPREQHDRVRASVEHL